MATVYMIMDRVTTTLYAIDFDGLIECRRPTRRARGGGRRGLQQIGAIRSQQG